METKLKVKKVGGSMALFLPRVYWDHLKIDKEEEEVTISDEEGKYGNFIAIWNKNKQEE